MVESEDMSIDEFFGDSIKSRDLLPNEKIDFFKKNYPIYKEGVLDFKNIKEGTIEYQFVSKGMDDYYNYIMRCFEIVESINKNKDNKSKSLFLSV